MLVERGKNRKRCLEIFCIYEADEAEKSKSLPNPAGGYKTKMYLSDSKQDK